MRLLRDSEIDVVSGGERGNRVWTFPSAPVKIIDSKGAIGDLKSNMLAGAIGGGIGGGPGGSILGALGGGVVAMHDIRVHIRQVTPSISIEECLPPGSTLDRDSDC
jgi:hypothetical protein